MTTAKCNIDQNLIMKLNPHLTGINFNALQSYLDKNNIQTQNGYTMCKVETLDTIISIKIPSKGKRIDCKYTSGISNIKCIVNANE